MSNQRGGGDPNQQNKTLSEGTDTQSRSADQCQVGDEQRIQEATARSRRAGAQTSVGLALNRGPEKQLQEVAEQEQTSVGLAMNRGEDSKSNDTKSILLVVRT